MNLMETHIIVTENCRSVLKASHSDIEDTYSRGINNEKEADEIDIYTSKLQQDGTNPTKGEVSESYAHHAINFVVCMHCLHRVSVLNTCRDGI